MEIKLKEQFNNLGLTGSTAWYEMKAYVESDHLDDIEQVEYFLKDPSIDTPVIVSDSVHNKFEIQAKSWKDSYPIIATVTFKNPKIKPVTLKSDVKVNVKI